MTHAERRSGATLVELVVALTLAAIVLGAAASSVLRQQRTTRIVVGEAATAAQLRAATGALSAELSVLSTAAGDIVPGEARDTALQLRAFVAAGVACDDAPASATFASGDDGLPEALWGNVPRVGDSLWWYAGDADAGWRGARIVASDSVTATCLLTGSLTRPARRVAVSSAGDTIPFGAPLRVTRPARYSFYKSGDGSWQLGLRDWIAGDHFGAPQPVAGPFLIRLGDRRSGFRYFGANGEELSGGSAGVDADQVARIRVTVLTAEPPIGAPSVVRVDSVDVALLSVRSP